MIYRSNLTAPEIQTYFHHLDCRVMGHSRGHDVLSDFADREADDPVFGIYKNCGFWTHDEAAILFNIAHRVGGNWLDIGGLTGWTAAHEAAAGCRVVAVDTMYAVPEFRARAIENLTAAGFSERVSLWAGTSDDFFASDSGSFDGIVIDGEHAPPFPLKDAMNAAGRISPGGVILFHDATWEAAKEGCRYLAGLGWKAKVYSTPHAVVLCHREGFTPPEHVAAPGIPAEVL
jgi:predicted O-methyltransferase YrrM